MLFTHTEYVDTFSGSVTHMFLRILTDYRCCLDMTGFHLRSPHSVTLNV